ncbi:hypothetical protein PBT90_16325 [Algoriphagus halophytocola]|uniref:hypothetical protein n=1 Tax=Algoriphagus halophytocola TaxID=2991499 RepID=UPI0022DD4F29|nr:hypothetical protein [Algoriphagus sp. TR-M9]WBL42303.1 hypothetical protein PBT90_16325 [Algoriphagus sp. TR-M9]
MKGQIEFTEFQILQNLHSGPTSFRALINLYNAFKALPPSNLLLDLKHIEFIDANLCASLDAIFYLLNKEAGHTFYIDHNEIKGRFEIFIRNGFVKLTGEELGEINSNSSAVRLTRFTPDSDEKFFHFLENFLFSNKAFHKMPQIRDDIIDHFCEIFSNIGLHARTNDPVFACGQFYPKKKVLKFTLVDLGIGFYEPIGEFLGSRIQSPLDAINWALEDGNTTKIDAIGGSGLSRLKLYCEEHGHIFQILTDGVCWTNGAGIFKHWEMEKFPGTTINLEFSCK